MNKITVGLVSAVMGGAMLVSGAGAASATTKYDSKVQIRDIDPNPVVVERGKDTTAYFNIGTTRDVSRVELSVEPAMANFRTRSKKDIHDLKGWRFSVDFNEHDPAGKWKATAVAYNRFGKVVAKDDAFFSVFLKRKADTRISRFSADPSAVRSGRSIYFTGYLQAEGRSWSGLRGERVSVYYRPTGSKTWKWVTSGTTSWNGKFSLKTRAWKSGTFRTVFSGNSRLDSATSGTDYVRVYR